MRSVTGQWRPGTGRGMADPMNRSSKPAPIAGGALLALSLVAGTIVGVRQGQPSIGFLAGLGIGIALLIIVALIDRLRGSS